MELVLNGDKLSWTVKEEKISNSHSLFFARKILEFHVRGLNTGRRNWNEP